MIFLRIIKSLCFCAVLVPGGCRTGGVRRESPEGLAKVGAILNSRRAASLKYWTDKKIRGEPPEDYVFCLTATILPLATAVHIETKREPDDVYSYSMRTSPKDRATGCDRAVMFDSVPVF